MPDENTLTQREHTARFILQTIQAMRLLAVLTLTFFTTTLFGQTTNPTKTNTTKPFILGVIEEIPSAILSETRTLNIYLPEGYSQSDTIKYPVVYLLDGAADEDFIHVVGLYQFNTFPWINRVPRSIIVGIVNTDRKRDFTYPTTVEEDKVRFPTTGRSDKFITFIEKELQPYIEAKYKTDTSKTIIGQSLGGLLAAEILLKKPALFNRYIIVSPSLWWDNGSLLNQSSELFQESFRRKTEIYIGVGKEGLAPTSVPHVMEVEANVLADKIKNTKSKSVRLYFDYLPEEDHATVGHQAVFNAIRLLSPLPTDEK